MLPGARRFGSMLAHVSATRRTEQQTLWMPWSVVLRLSVAHRTLRTLSPLTSHASAVATYLSMDPTTGEQRDVYQEVPGKTFMQQQLPTQRMVQAGIRGNLMLMTRGSKFIKFQVRSTACSRY